MHKIYFCLLLGLFFGNSLSAQSDSIYTNAERMPYFPGCTAYRVGSNERRQCSNQTVKAYIFNHIVYPQAAKDANIEGAVYVRFIVDEMGYVQSPNLLKDIGGGCGESAISVLKAMPQWEPAFHKGKPVKVALDLPIHFYFKENDLAAENAYSIVWGQLNEYEVNRKTLRKNLDKVVTVFDVTGQPMTISDLRFSYVKNNKVIQKGSNGAVTSRMEKMVRKLKKGGLFSIVATVQKNGQFIEVAKEYAVVD